MEFDDLVAFSNSKVEEIGNCLSALKIEANFDGRTYAVRTEHVSINFYLHCAYPATNSRIILGEFKGALIFSNEQKMYSRNPVRLSTKEYNFDYQAAYGWCWRQGKSGEQFLNTHHLGEQIIKQLLELQEQFERGDIKWNDWP
jgi:hypothetical protein